MAKWVTMYYLVVLQLKLMMKQNFLNRGFVAASSKDRDFKHIPTQDEIKLSDNAAYLHLCYNNTIYGTELHEDLDSPVPMIADMSSDIFSRPIDVF